MQIDVSQSPWWWIRVLAPGRVVTTRRVEPRPIRPSAPRSRSTRSMSAFWPVPRSPVVRGDAGGHGGMIGGRVTWHAGRVCARGTHPAIGTPGRAQAGADVREAQPLAALRSSRAPGAHLRPAPCRAGRLSAPCAHAPGPLRSAQATRQTRHSAAGSDSGSPWTRKKSAGPPSAITPASRPRRAARRRATSPRRAPPTARARRRRATRPPTRAGSPAASRRRSPCRRRSPTPARRAAATDASARSSRAWIALRPSAPAKRGIAVVRANVSHERMTARVETRNVPRWAISRGQRVVQLEPVLDRVDAAGGRRPARPTAGPRGP